MYLKINKDNLISILTKTEKITGKSASLPVLANLVIETQGDFVIAKATNLDIGVEAKTKAKIEKEGRVIVSGHTLLSFLNNLPKKEKEIAFLVEDGNIKIETESSKTKIKTYSEDEYPTIPEVRTSKVVKIDSKKFLDGLRSVWYAASVSSIKPELASIYVFKDGDDVVFVATDSFRLAEKKIKVSGLADFGNILIPFKNAVEIIRVFDGVDGEIEIFIDEDQIGIRNSDTYLVSRIVDGNFPDYKQIVPKAFTTKVSILKEDFSQAIKMVNIFADKFSQANFEVSVIKETLTINSENQEKGNSNNIVGIKAEGEDVSVNFNFKYIQDCLTSIDSDSLVFEFNGKTKPLVIRGMKDGSFMYLVMPMNR